MSPLFALSPTLAEVCKCVADDKFWGGIREALKLICAENIALSEALGENGPVGIDETVSEHAFGGSCFLSGFVKTAQSKNV